MSLIGSAISRKLNGGTLMTAEPISQYLDISYINQSLVHYQIACSLPFYTMGEVKNAGALVIIMILKDLLYCLLGSGSKVLVVGFRMDTFEVVEVSRGDDPRLALL